MAGDLKPAPGRDLGPRDTTAAETPSRGRSELDAFWAGVASVPAAPPVDTRIPGVKPDPTALAPWVDGDHHAPKAPKAPATPASLHDQLVDMQATAHAAALIATRGTTGDAHARWQFLNTLDRVADPAMRHKMMAKFAVQTGTSLQDFITTTDWHSRRDQEQALDLISPKRDAAEHEMQAMSPAARKKLTADASGWSQQVLDVTRGEDANDDANAVKISRVLGQRSPVEIEAIRAAVRTNTRDKSIYQELDRSLSGGNEDEALAGLKGDPVHAASMAIANADGNSARVEEILRDLKAEQRTELSRRNGPLGASMITRSVHESQRGEIQQLVAGSEAAANGAHFADLFKDPKAGLEMDGIMPTEQSQQNFEARKPENVIKELRSKSPAEIEAARAAWDKQNPGRRWDLMIQERFGDGDPTTFLRINALAHGNKIEERAYALREGMRKNNQETIEAALANPDLDEKDPKKRAAAEAEKQQLAARVRELDAMGQRATAMMTGQDPTTVVGRDLDQQLEDHYKEFIANDPHLTDPAALLQLVSDRDGARAKREVQARDESIAAGDLRKLGELAPSTQIRRAETKHDTKRKAQLIENLGSNAELTSVGKDFRDKYDTDMLAEPGLAQIDATAQFLKSQGDDRPLSEIKARVADDMQDSHELRIEHVREFGVKAERPAHLQHVLQKEVYAKQHSGSLTAAEKLREGSGGNAGTEDLVQSELAVQDEMLEAPTGPFGTGPRALKPGVERDEFTQIDKNLTQTLDVQREEKLKHAERLATTFATIAKVGALLVAKPELFALIDIAAGLGAIAIKQSAAGPDYDQTDDVKMLGLTAVMDLAMIPIAGMGTVGTAANAERAAQSAAKVGENTATELVEHGATAEAKKEIAGAGAKVAAGESRLVEKQLASATENGVESGASQLAANAETSALSLAEGKIANEGVTAAKTAVDHGKVAANIGVGMAGSVAGGVVQGETSDDLLVGLTRTMMGMFIPGHLAAKLEKLIGNGSKARRALGSIAGIAGDTAANVAISGGGTQGALDAVMNAGSNKVQKHAHVASGSSSHGDDDAYAPRRTTSDPESNPLAHYAEDPEPRRRVDSDADPAAESPRRHEAADEAHSPRRPLHASDGAPESSPHADAQGLPHAGARPVANRHADEAVAPPTEATSTKARREADDHKHELARRIQALANGERGQAIAAKQHIFTEIDQLAGLATTNADWEYIRKMEHDAGRPVSERYSPHDELAAIQQYERAGGLKHPDGTPFTPDEAKAWIAQAKGEIQPGIDAKTTAHNDAIASLTGEVKARIAQRDAAKTQELADKAKVAPVDEEGRRIVTVDEAISVGMGGAGAAGAKQGHTDRGGDVVARKDRMAIEDGTKTELWNGLREKSAGQEANAVGYGTDGIRTTDVAEHPTAQVARASEIALQVAAQRNDSQVGTVASNGPVGELQIKRVTLPDGREVLEVGVPAKMVIDGVEQVVVVTTIKGVDLSTGMGEARQLTTDKTEGTERAKQIDDAHATKLKEAGALLTGEQALAAEASHFKGKRVLGIGGGATSEWVAEHAQGGKAASVELVGTLPRPDKGSVEGKTLTQLEADIRALAMSGQEVPLAMTQQHQQIVEAHVQSQQQRLADIATQLEGDLQPLQREKAMAEQARIKGDIDPFLGSRVDRNHATLNSVKHGQADIMFMKPAADGGVEVIFTDGTRTVVDQVIPSIGADHSAPGGIDSMLKALPMDVQMIPVIAEGRVVGLESNPPGISVSGAALTGSTGLNMPKKLLASIPEDMRDAFMTSVIDHANRAKVSGGSRGIVPGIENVGQNPQLMQEVLALPPEQRAAALQDFLDMHRETRKTKFDGEARFDNKVLNIKKRAPAAY